MSEEIKTKYKNKYNNDGNFGKEPSSVIDFNDIKKKIQILRSKNETYTDSKLDLEINKDVLNSFKRNNDQDTKKSSGFPKLENTVDNTVNNSSFIKENNSFINRNERKDNSDPFFTNFKLDRSRDNESKADSIVNQKFISLIKYGEKDKPVGKVNNTSSSKLFNYPLKNDHDKSPKNINQKLNALSEKMVNNTETNNITERNDLNSLNHLTKELDQSPKIFISPKMEGMRKNILSCFGEEKENLEKKVYQKPKDTVFEEFLEKKNRIESTYSMNKVKKSDVNEYCNISTTSVKSNISSKSNTSDNKNAFISQSKINNNNQNTNTRLKSRIEDFVKNIDKTSQKDEYSNLNKLGSLNKYQEKPSLLIRKPELEYKLSMSPKKFVNEFNTSVTPNKITDVSTIGKKNEYKGMGREKKQSLNFEVSYKNSPKNNKKIDILEKIVKIEDLKNLSHSIRFLSEDNINNLDENYVFELKSLCSVVNKIFNKEKSNSYLLKNY